MVPDGLYKYRHQIVRDLAWVVFSPVMLNPKTYTDFRFDNGSILLREQSDQLSFLQFLDEQPAQLIDYISAENSKLIGKYFESLVKFWLEYGISSYELIASNLQVNSNGRTMGEFDFIIHDKINDKFVHLEVAGKFFLANRNVSEHGEFVGPNGLDNLKTKLEKFQNEQMHLSENPDSQKLLGKLGINQKLEKTILLKGYIFYNYNYFFNDSYTQPAFASPNHLKGWWIRINEANNFFEQKNSKWIIVERKNWVSRVYYPSEKQIITSGVLLGKLQEYFHNNSYPILVAELDGAENGIPFETSRGFVVSNSWPNDKRK